MKLTASQPVIAAGSPGIIGLAGRYLYGAPASNLGLEGEMVISASSEVSGFPGFRVGQESEKFTTVRKELEALPNTDAAGASAISIALPGAWVDTTARSTLDAWGGPEARPRHRKRATSLRIDQPWSARGHFSGPRTTDDSRSPATDADMHSRIAGRPRCPLAHLSSRS